MEKAPVRLAADFAPGWAARQLPHRTPELTGLALEVVGLAASLLASIDATLLCIPLSAREDAVAPVAFDRRLLASTRPWPDDSVTLALLRALDEAAAAVYLLLKPHWPAYALPAQLAVITDGSGLAFSPEDPWPLAPGWIARQASGDAGLTDILPFASGGPWAMLIHPARAGQLN